jgi:primary-amine oxidase
MSEALSSAAFFLALSIAAGHPLDGLSTREHWTVYDVLRASGHLDEKTLYAGVQLREPPKAEVLAWKPGQEFRREALAILVQAGKTYEAVVDVRGGKLLSWAEVPGAQAALVESEERASEELMKANPEVIAALKRRGITDLTVVECWGVSPGYFGRPEERERRLIQGFCSDRHGAYNTNGRPIEGLYALIDVTEKKVLRVVDTGTVPVPADPADFHPEALGRTRETPGPISVTRPQGPGFSLEGQVVRWQKWRFHFRMDPRRGAVVSDVRYADGERERSILYQGSLSELFVPYMDPAETWYNQTYMDVGEDSARGLPRSLERDVECPDHAAYFDAVFATDRGVPSLRPRVACLFERSSGDAAWTHLDREQGGVQARPRRDLVLRWTATVGNYDYVFDWTFLQNGSIQVGVGATGVVAIKAALSRTAAAQDGSREPRDDAYGRFVAPNTVAVNHDHFFSYRLDLDVDGPVNSFEIDRLKPRRLPEAGARKSLWVVEPQTAASESQARLDPHADAEAFWRVVNPAARGPMGYPTSYEIRPAHGVSSLLAPDDPPQARAGFSRHALWVTPYRPGELYAAGDYPTQSRGGDGLPAWTAADRPIQGTDIVAWYTIGMHHVVRAEDWPVMPVVWHTFEIRPFDFFADNPALDLPVKP